ncbi:TIGR01906 family membrane protein, partial [Streptococcus uberis]
IIWILPETFFMHCFIGFLVVYEAVFGILLFKSKIKK